MIPEVGAKGIYYLELQPGYKLEKLFVDPNEIYTDIYVGSEKTLIYSFYNPTQSKTIGITASIEKDKDGIYSKLKSDKLNLSYASIFLSNLEF